MTRTYLKFDRKTALQYQLQMVTELLTKNTSILDQLKSQHTDMKNMRNMLTECPDTWKPLLQLLKPVSKEADDAKKVLFQEKVVQFLKTKFTAISLMLEDHKSPTVRYIGFLSRSWLDSGTECLDLGQATFQGNGGGWWGFETLPGQGKASFETNQSNNPIDSWTIQIWYFSGTVRFYYFSITISFIAGMELVARSQSNSKSGEWWCKPMPTKAKG